MTQIFTNLENAKHAPSVQMQDVPRDMMDFEDDVEEDTKEAIDTRGGSMKLRDERIVPENEFFDRDEDVYKTKDMAISIAGEISATEPAPASALAVPPVQESADVEMSDGYDGDVPKSMVESEPAFPAPEPESTTAAIANPVPVPEPAAEPTAVPTTVSEPVAEVAAASAPAPAPAPTGEPSA